MLPNWPTSGGTTLKGPFSTVSTKHSTLQKDSFTIRRHLLVHAFQTLIFIDYPRKKPMTLRSAVILAEETQSGHGESLLFVVRLEEEDWSDLAIAELRDNRIEILLSHLCLTSFLYCWVGYVLTFGSARTRLIELLHTSTYNTFLGHIWWILPTEPLPISSNFPIS